MDKVEEAILLAELKKELPEYDFEIRKVVKFNDKPHDEVYIGFENGAYAPLFNPENYKGMLYSDIAKHMKEVLDIFTAKQYEIAETLLSDTFVLDNVKLQLLSTHKNREYLKDKPSFKINSELSALFYIPFDKQADNRGIITKDLIDELSIDPTELNQAALSNMFKDMELQYLSKIASNITLGKENAMNNDDFTDITAKLNEGTLDTMIVLSNHERQYGAATILCNEFLQNCKQDLVILPSSTHEVMLLPYTGKTTDLKELQAIVQFVNTTEVDELEQLSDSVYLYDHKTQEISLACDRYGLVPICDDSKLTLPEISSLKR